MTDILSLTDLCSICHNEEWKYRCPRCSALTCSLPCITKHKARASCNGRRDPAAYLKKSQLESATGIDRDFNFLTGVERAFSRAEHDTASRGIRIGEQVRPKPFNRSIEQAIIESQVDVRRAPKGLSRAKDNRTDLSGDGHTLNWTVEWLLNDGDRIMKNFPIDVTIHDAASRLNFRSRHSKRNNKRKRRNSDQKAESLKQAGISDDCSLALKPTKVEAKEEASGSAQPEILAVEGSTHEAGQQGPKLIPVSSSKRDVHAVNKIPPGGPPSNYYLHRPLCPGPARVLIPLAPDTTFRDALYGRTVVEFPTIYILNETHDKLPSGFITEDAWRSSSRGIQELEQN